MKKLLTASILATISSWPAVAAAPDFQTPAPIAYLVDMSSGAVLYSKDPDRRMPPASMAKMMTVYVAFGLLNWNRNFTSTKFSFAGALMAGFGYQLTPSATLDIGYRFVDLDLSGATHNTAQQLTVGVRYMLN